MPAPGAERRSSEKAPLPPGYTPEAAGAAAALRDAEGFYTRAALVEFIQYEVDGSAQTMLNELFVAPMCLAAVGVEPVGREAERERAVLAVGDAVRKLTRVADRVARDGDCFLLLLRRTMAKNVLEHFGPRLKEMASEALTIAEARATLSVGVASLVEHMVRGPEDMIRKARRALEEARKDPGSLVAYDFRVMPLDD